MTRRAAGLLILAVLMVGQFSVVTAGAADLPNYAIPGGRFYPETGDGSGRGYAVTDAGGLPFWTKFSQVGGVPRMGYPISNRWTSGPFVRQAFQKGILQVAPGQQVTFVNIYDNLAAMGFDNWLDIAHNVPQGRLFPEEAGLVHSEIVFQRLAILDENPAIRDAWLSNPRWHSMYGLPIAYEDRGAVRVLRAQRAVFQEWMIDTSFTKAGTVLTANAGDHYKQAGLIPMEATSPVDPIPAVGVAGKIAFVSQRGGRWDLHTVRPDGSDIQRVTDLHEVNGRPSWSADGTMITFAAWFGGSYNIFTVRPDGSELLQLTTNPSIDWEPWLAPDASQVSFVSTREGGVGALFLMNADGSDQRRLSPNSGAYCYPTWSPDGETLLYEYGGVLGMMRVDGQPIEEGVIQKPLFPGSDPSWSPDGTQIAFARIMDGNHEIFIANADGSGEKRLTAHPAQDTNPAWSPDGTSIAFGSYRDNNWEIYTMAVDGTDLRRVTNDPATDFLPTWGVDPDEVAATTPPEATPTPDVLAFAALALGAAAALAGVGRS